MAIEREALRVELESVRRQTAALTEAQHRGMTELRTVHEQRVDALNEAAAAARTSLAKQRSELKALQRENTNLVTLNNNLTGRIDKTQSKLSSTECQLQALTAQRTAEQREWDALQAMMTARLADKDELIATLQQQLVEPPNNLGPSDENEIDGA